MRQLLQSLGSGVTELVEAPVPSVQPGSIVLETRASVVSPGTERMLVDFGRSGLVGKVRRQPEKVKEVIDKALTDGVGSTLEAVRSKLDQPVPLGYCNAGVVRAVAPDVTGFDEGDRVVTNGAHAEYVRAPRTLAARIPDGVSFEAGAFAPLAAIGLQGLRLARPSLGETVVVYGLGLIGLLTVQLARTHGCRVIGIDRVTARLDLAEGFGAHPIEASDGMDVASAVRDRTGGTGADAVLLTLASESDEPIRLAAEMSRKRGRLVLVGATGLTLRREDFYEKELSFQVSCSYGPGRYDPEHEEGAQDYPLPFVRWTEARNFAAALELMREGRLDPLPLVTHRLPFERATEAYDVIMGNEPALGVVLEYPGKDEEAAVRGRTVQVGEDRSRGPGVETRGNGTVAFIGAGNFASRVLMPAFKDAGATLHTVVASAGTSAAIAGRKYGFARVSTEPDAVFSDPDIDTVVVATRHDTHAMYVLRALEAGKHVFVEKPLAISREDIDRIGQAFARRGSLLCVGFNRRFAPWTRDAKAAIEGRSGPLAINVTVNAGKLPDDHWTKDPTVGGGRLIGEACHFIDLARFLVAHPIVDAYTTSALDPGGRRIEDVSLVQLRFDDGSIASIQYLANGPARFPKERVELFWDGKALQTTDFHRYRGWGARARGRRLWRRGGKGHQELVKAFLDAVTGNAAPPIPVSELLEVSGWTIAAGAGDRTIRPPCD